MTTAQNLLNSCKYDSFDDLSFPTIADYFGINNISSEERMVILLGLYEGMYRFINDDDKFTEQLHNNLVSNSLMTFIHSFYQNKQTGYYKKFVDLNIVIPFQQ